MGKLYGVQPSGSAGYIGSTTGDPLACNTRPGEYAQITDVARAAYVKPK